jgi:uncharacterized protein YeaO (DUF488 family)
MWPMGASPRVHEPGTGHVLKRYTIYRGSRPVHDPLPFGVRKDTRKHTKHPLRPTPELVEAYLASPTEAAWRRFRSGYRALLQARFANDRARFDELAALAADNDVHLGCSCPTRKNPRVERCHTYLALQFMKTHYPSLDVELPKTDR